MGIGSRTPNTIAPDADALEQALRAAGLDPDGVLSWPIWNTFVNRGLRPALAAIEERSAPTMIENKMQAKPLGGQRQQRSADNPLGLSEADRAHMKSGGRVMFTKNADGSTTKTHVRGPRGTTSGTVRPRVKQTLPARQPSKAELRAIHDRWLSPDAQLVNEIRTVTAAVDELLELNEQRRRSR